MRRFASAGLWVEACSQHWDSERGELRETGRLQVEQCLFGSEIPFLISVVHSGSASSSVLYEGNSRARAEGEIGHDTSTSCG